MITFIWIVGIAILGIGFALIAYGANNRKRTAKEATRATGAEQPSQGRATGLD